MKHFLLIGNPNTGKTTLFNALTGSTLPAGNRAGVTVEASKGITRKGLLSAEITDLPGTYSLTPFTDEEAAVTAALEKKDFDAAIAVIDSLNPARSLSLGFSLFEYGVPVVFAFNFADDLRRHGKSLDEERATVLCSVPCIAVSALKGEGLGELLIAAENAEIPKKHFSQMPDELYKQTEKLIPELFDGKSGIKKAGSANPDKMVLHKYFGYPILILLTALVFLITFSGPVEKLSQLLDAFFSQNLGGTVGKLLSSIGCNRLFISLICDGIIEGIGGVLAFLPQITVLTALMAVFEDSGYLSRTAYLCDRPFRVFGLQGKCFFCAMIGFGCTVPAAMSVRILDSPREKIKTLFLLPFMSCSAKLPLYLLLGGLIFKSSLTLPVLMYSLGIVLGFLLLYSFNAGSRKRPENKSSFFLELPPYRVPSAVTVTRMCTARLKEFLFKAGTVLVIDSIIVWLLSSFTADFTYTVLPGESLIASIGRFILPIFEPLGITQWQQSAAFISGGIAREAIVSSLKILYNGDVFAISGAFSPESALSFSVLSLLWLPCSAALLSLKRELKNKKLFLLYVVFQGLFAYFTAFAVYRISSLFL